MGRGAVVLCLCEVLVWIICIDGRSRYLCLADTCSSEVHPVFNTVAPYEYLLPNMHLLMADITNPESFI